MKFLKKIFSKKEAMVAFDYSIIENDIHSHLIPGIDDGSKSMEESIELVKGLISLGYKKAVTTPHIMSDYYKNTPEIINIGLKALNAQIQQEGLDITIVAAAEYYTDFEFQSAIAKNKLLTFNKNYVLIECSFVEAPKNLNEVVFELQTNGYKPILAHPERYLYWQNTLENFHKLKERGVLFQLNLLSLAGIYSEQSKNISEYLIEKNLIDFVGTDLHNPRQLAMLEKLQVKESVWNNIKNLNLKNKNL